MKPHDENSATLSWGPESWSVQTLGTRQVGDVLWVEVEVLSHSPCEEYPLSADCTERHGLGDSARHASCPGPELLVLCAGLQSNRNGLGSDQRLSVPFRSLNAPSLLCRLPRFLRE